MKTSKKIFIWTLIITGILSIVIPFIIQIAYNTESSEGSFWLSTWTAGDFLSYCGSIIGSIIVVITVWYTLRTTKEDTQQSIDITRKQFTVDLAMNSFMEYADAFSYTKFDDLFSKISKQYTNTRFETTLDEIFTLQINITESQQKAYFYLSEEEQNYMDSKTPNVEKAGNLLEEIYKIVNDTLTLESNVLAKLKKDQYQIDKNNLYQKYKAKVEETGYAIIEAHKEILEHLKEIINTRLEFN